MSFKSNQRLHPNTVKKRKIDVGNTQFLLNIFHVRLSWVIQHWTTIKGEKIREDEVGEK